jgi:hypothetical protein
MTQEAIPETVLPSPPEEDDTGAHAVKPRGLVARLCFDRGDYALLRIVDDVLSRQSSSSLRRLLAPYLHPHGIKEMAAPKGLRIAYATIHLLGSLEVGLAGDRLTALRSLRDEVMVAAESDLEKNTARVLLQIMKELVRSKGKPRRQLELAHDFRSAVPGKPRIIRRLLTEFHLLEMPEQWNQLAFDDHIHDANTKGRKSPTHLIMDAWIKGIRRLTVIHYHFVRRETASELLEAAAIMDMDVHIGIECLARIEGRPIKIIWTPRGISHPHDFNNFLTAPGVAAFMDQGFELAARQQRYVLALLAAFNERHRPTLRERFGLDIEPIDPEAFLAFVGAGQASVQHLARHIRNCLLPHLNRQSEEMLRTMGGRQDSCPLLAERDALDTESLLDAYLSPEANPDIPRPEAILPDETPPERLTLSPRALVERITALHRQNRITLVAAELPIEDVLLVLAQCRGAITTLEVFNLRLHESRGRAGGEILELLAVLNTGNVVALKRLIHRVADRLEKEGGPADKSARVRALAQDIATLAAAYRKKPLAARIGTDSSGQSTRHHGMGLVVRDTLPPRARRHLDKAARKNQAGQRTQRQALPVGVAVAPRVTAQPEAAPFGCWSRFLQSLRDLPGLRLLGYRVNLEWMGRRYYKATPPTANIFTLGGIQPKASARYLAEARAEKAPLRPSVRYLNTTLKNTLKILAGFAVAAASFAAVNTWWVMAWLGPFLWFGITGFRNVVQSVLGCGGIRRSPLISWKNFVNMNQISDSLLYSGLSVPLLEILIKTIILGQGFNITTTTNPVVLFTVMALANGFYLVFHNLFRGMSKTVAAGNFFRSALSIPLALGMNWVLAWLLATQGVAAPEAALQSYAVIISKFASECLAAAIEGLADRARFVRLRLRDYQTKFKQLYDTYSLLELLYPEEDASRLLEVPKTLIDNPEVEKRDLDKILIVNALDFLYFWMYQPRARTVLTRAIRAMSLEERRVFLLSQYVLLREKEISRLFIDGLVGKKFAKALSFYLSNAHRYLDDIQRLARRHPAAEALSLENALMAGDSVKYGP